MSSSSAKEASGAFATTHWSVVLHAQDAASPLVDSALESLCRAYWYPLYAYIRRSGHDATAAQDLTQEFFAQLLRKKLLAGVDPRKGRFRSWLLGVMNHFLAHEWTRTRAQKRGGGFPVLSWDQLEAEERYRLEPAEEPAPERVFDRRWAFTVLERAASRLRREYEEAGNWRVYDCLRDFVANEAAIERTEETARELGMTISATKSAIHRLRRRYQELVRAEIAETVGSESEINEEIRYLLAMVQDG